MEEYDLDEFEAMEAEAEAAASQKKPMPMPKQNPPMRAAVRPGQPNPNIVPSQNPQVKQPVRSAPVQQPQPQLDEAQPLWVAYYQPEVIGIVNTQTGERIEGFKDEGIAQAQARILNDLNTVIISGGYQ